MQSRKVSQLAGNIGISAAMRQAIHLLQGHQVGARFCNTGGHTAYIVAVVHSVSVTDVIAHDTHTVFGNPVEQGGLEFTQ